MGLQIVPLARRAGKFFARRPLVFIGTAVVCVLIVHLVTSRRYRLGMKKGDMEIELAPAAPALLPSASWTSAYIAAPR